MISKFQSAELFTPSFVMLCIASLFFFTATHLLSPVLPLYFQSFQFDGATIGTLMAAFLLASMCFRPWVGRLADQTSKKRLMVWGLVIFTVCPFLYTLFSEQWAIFVVRLIHGIGFALFYTAATSMAVELVPVSRRVEGISHYSNAIKIAMAFSPTLGLWFASNQLFQQSFWLSGGIAALALIFILFLPQKRAVNNIKKYKNNQLELEPANRSHTSGRLFSRSSIVPGLVMASNSLAFGALIPYVPLLAQEKMLANEGYFYVAYALCLIFSRGLTGGLADRYGRSLILLPGLALVSFALIVLAFSTSDWFFVIAAGVYGMAAGTIQPSLLAVAVDRAPKNETGSAMATFTMLSDLGVAAGQFLMSYLGHSYGYANSLVLIAMLSMGGWLLYWWQDQKFQPSLEGKPAGAV